MTALVACDVTSAKSVQALRDAAPTTVDVVIAMAGGNLDIGSGPVETDLTSIARAWSANFDLNALGTVLVVTALADRMPAGSAIVTVSSIGAEYAASSYGAAKAAIAAWTAGVSSRLGPRGITINTIAPGYIEDTEFFGDTMTQQRRDTLIAATHNKRAGTPADIAGAAWFLASNDARHITGQILHVNGGAHTTR
ncbi:MAG: SDR family oxidoreductase [Gordonia sp. (in: high G+C Gram-positive bacteria)]